MLLAWNCKCECRLSSHYQWRDLSDHKGQASHVKLIKGNIFIFKQRQGNLNEYHNHIEPKRDEETTWFFIYFSFLLFFPFSLIILKYTPKFENIKDNIVILKYASFTQNREYHYCSSPFPPFNQKGLPSCEQWSWFKHVVKGFFMPNDQNTFILFV